MTASAWCGTNRTEGTATAKNKTLLVHHELTAPLLSRTPSAQRTGRKASRARPYTLDNDQEPPEAPRTARTRHRGAVVVAIVRDAARLADRGVRRHVAQ